MDLLSSTVQEIKIPSGVTMTQQIKISLHTAFIPTSKVLLFCHISSIPAFETLISKRFKPQCAP